MELDERIKQHMDAKEWKLADLARETGIAKGYLWELLQVGGRKRPSADTLYKISQALGTTVADLLGRAPEAGPATGEDISQSLQAFAAEVELSHEDTAMLAMIRFRGEQPKTKEDWRFLWESIRRAVRG